jgi:hypothetical protein
VPVRYSGDCALLHPQMQETALQRRATEDKVSA